MKSVSRKEGKQENVKRSDGTFSKRLLLLLFLGWGKSAYGLIGLCLFKAVGRLKAHGFFYGFDGAMPDENYMKQHRAG